ncbi:uncharacterized protein LOC142238809 [Haematobia irritans]|uniref:uncharacterized protein LOC142238809 n=1 Tax=Haematobia irritans TaxID=7368 RepID=UPI003F504F91
MTSKYKSENSLENDSSYHPFKFSLRSKYLKNSRKEISRIKDRYDYNQDIIRSIQEKLWYDPTKSDGLEPKEKTFICEDRTSIDKNEIETQTDMGFSGSSLQDVCNTNEEKSEKEDNLDNKVKSPNKSNPIASGNKPPYKSSAKHQKLLTEISLRRTKPKSPIWKSSMSSSMCSKHRLSKRQNPQFSYDLSADELRAINNFKSPMKPPSEHDQQLLKGGSRLGYLRQRYLSSPDDKYNYPEATSWRIGWLHSKV